MEQQEIKRSGRGGWRGGGRPATDRKKCLSVRISPEAWEKIAELKNKNKFFDELIKRIDVPALEEELL